MQQKETQRHQRSQINFMLMTIQKHQKVQVSWVMIVF